MCCNYMYILDAPQDTSNYYPQGMFLWRNKIKKKSHFVTWKKCLIKSYIVRLYSLIDFTLNVMK